MGFMRAHRNDIAQQEFKMTVIRKPPPARSSPAPSTPGPSTSTAADEDEWETPNSLDALEPRLTEEACWVPHPVRPSTRKTTPTGSLERS